MNRRHLLAVIATGLAWGAGAACSEPTISEKDAEAYVEEWRETVAKHLQRQAEGSRAEDHFKGAVQKAAEAAAAKTDRREPPYDVLVRDVYRGLDWELKLVDRDGFSGPGTAVWSALQSVHEHAIDPAPFPRKVIAEKHAKLGEYVEDLKSARQFRVNQDEKKAALEYLTRQPTSEFELLPANFKKLTEVVLEGEGGGRMQKRVDRLQSVAKQKASLRAELEQLLARNTVRYSRELRHFRIRHIKIHGREADYWSMAATKGRRPDKAKGPLEAGRVWRKAARVADEMQNTAAILDERMRKTLRQVLEAEDEAGAAEVLADLEPAHPDYAALRKEYVRYKKIVENGGWEKVEPTRLRPGSKGPTVLALKKRLAAEGYFPGQPPEKQGSEEGKTYGGKLENAVEAYQTTHQMKVTGRPHNMFWASINKTAEHRLAQIELNLKRWRESNVRHDKDPIYVLVNIPEFTVEAWKQGERKLKFPIVVGNTKVDYDKEKDEKTHPNHTPTLSAYVDRVIYNPYWNVTDRIREEEILPKVRKSLEKTYKAKLVSLRRKVKEAELRRERQQQQMRDEQQEAPGGILGGPFGSEDSADSADSTDSPAGPDDQMLVAAGPGNSDSADSTGGAAESDAPTARADSQNGRATGAKAGPKADEKIEVSIDDLYRVGEKDFMGKRKIIFNVDGIRALLAEVRGLNSNGDSKAAGAGGAKEMGAMGDDGSETAENAGESEDGENGEDGEKKGPVASAFPYLDPETGRVDVSTTDPDNVPAWYKANDYEVVAPGKKWEYVRQKQGDGNALGRVKVIFPNPHYVYLHDTPKKKLFKRDIRAFSHGCMRMERPLDLAEFLLRQDGKFGQVNLKELLKGEEKEVMEDGEKVEKMVYEYKPIFMDKKIPVHVDYFTVRPDDQGRANFFADIYDKDEKAVSGL